MTVSLSDTLVVGISATALFDLGEADKVFRNEWSRNPDTAVEVYRDYMQQRETEPLNPGTGFHLVKALLSLNAFQSEGKLNYTKNEWAMPVSPLRF